LIRFTVDRKPNPRTKAKDPEIIKRAEDAAAEESASGEAKKERRTPKMVIEFGESCKKSRNPVILSQSQTDSSVLTASNTEGGPNKTIDLTGLQSSNILQALQSAQA
jgi:hypothetical protein